MALVQRRDQVAFRRLVGRHLDSVHRYLTRMTRSTFDADELSQEAFLKLWQRAGSYRPGRVRFTTWLHTIAHNLAVDALRRNNPQTGHAEAVAVDEAPGPEAHALAAESAQLLERALGALPPNQRAAVLLCQVQGFSNRDAAAIVGVSVHSLESLLARGRRTLRLAMLAADGDRDDTR